MKRIYNFNPGPAMLPLSVLEQAKEAVMEFAGTGQSILEISHRSKPYEAVHNKAVTLIKEILGLSDRYKVLFLGGGATLQFTMVPHNLLYGGKFCDFTVTGTWAKKAYSDAKKVAKVNVLYDGVADNYLNLPDPASLKVNPEATYFHMTSNETIGGVQWKSWPDAGNVPIICDMSSDFLSRRIPVDKFGMIYAGAQKNLGPAGLAVVIIRDDLLAACNPNLTAYLSYPIHDKENSLYNTPPVYAIYVTCLVLEWLKGLGGLPAAERMAQQRADLIYGAMNQSKGFYSCPVPAHCRSLMNVVFRLPNEQLEAKFLSEATALGMANLKGHRSVGGCRASIYNAMPLEGAQALADFMASFASKNG